LILKSRVTHDCKLHDRDSKNQLLRVHLTEALVSLHRSISPALGLHVPQ
jgi:hypothetical protein